MTEISIPREALEAAEIALLDCWESGEGNAGVIVHTAIRAALAAWPGMHIHEWQRPWLGGMSGTDIILPLTETDNAEA